MVAALALGSPQKVAAGIGIAGKGGPDQPMVDIEPWSGLIGLKQGFEGVHRGVACQLEAGKIEGHGKASSGAGRQ
jgi:hypothetical protein